MKIIKIISILLKKNFTFRYIADVSAVRIRIPTRYIRWKYCDNINVCNVAVSIIRKT